MGYAEELQFVIESDDSIFPDFLFTTLFNDFGDDYYSKAKTDDPRVIEAQKIRRKYRDYFDFLSARVAYNEYMDFLVEKYGSISIIRNSEKVGLFDEFLPPKPKLKMNRKNKEFVRAKIVPSQRINMNLEPGSVREIADIILPITSNSEISEDDRFKKLDKKTQKAAKKALEVLAGQNRRDNLYRSSGVNNGIDFIIEYMNQASSGYYEDGGKRVEYTIADILKEEEAMKGIPEEIIEDRYSSNTSIISEGRVIPAKDKQKLEIMKDLYKVGINLLDGSKSMDKHAVKMIKMSVGDYDESDTSLMSKKELKAFKKRKKKEQEDIIKRQDNDRLLANTLIGNKFSFSENGANISFRLRDMYRDN